MNNKIKTIFLCALALTVIAVGSAIADETINDNTNGHKEPSSNAGDGEADGSEYEAPNGPYGDGTQGNGNSMPAPNAGDGIPDGPGWT